MTETTHSTHPVASESDTQHSHISKQPRRDHGQRCTSVVAMTGSTIGLVQLLLACSMTLALAFPPSRMMGALVLPPLLGTCSSRLVLARSVVGHDITRRPTSSHCAASVQPHDQERIFSLPESKSQEQQLRFDPSKPYFPIFYNDVYEVQLPEGHRFPMKKYRQVRKLVEERISNLPDEERERITCELRVSPIASVEELTTTHSPEYVDRYLRGDMTVSESRNVGFPWSTDGVARSLSSVGGTVAAAVSICDALRETDAECTKEKPPIWASHLAGGTHHAFYDRGEGFCVFSDIAVAANVVLKRYPRFIRRVLIIDLDVHQGNGNAVLFQGRDDVLTFSMHCDANYFSPKEESDLDIELPAGCNDETYLATLRHWLKQVDLQGGDFDMIFFQSGVDGLGDDRLGRMQLTSEGLQRRNAHVFDFAFSKKVPLVITMGGGYPRHGLPWTPVLEAHANVYTQAHQYLRNKAV